MKNYTLLETIKRFLSPMKENKGLLYFAIFYFIIDAITNIGLLYSFKEIVDNIESGINIYFYLFLFFIVLKFFEVIIFRNFFGIFYPEMRKYFYSKYLKKFLELDNNYTENQGTGKIISIIDKSNMVWLEQLTAFFQNFLSGFLNAFFSLFIVFFINFYYGVVLIFLISFVFLIVTIVQRINRKYRIERREINIDTNRKIISFVMSKFEILQNFKGDNEIEKIKINLDINKTLNKKMSSNYVYFDLFSNFIVLGTRLFLVVLFLFGFNKGIVSLGEFVVLVSFSYILEASLKLMIGMYMNFSNSLVDIEKVWEFFDSKSHITGYEEGNEFKYENGNIEIKNMSFYYYEGKDIFKNFDLNIEGGKITAFVGNSGSGKTTLVKLISGYIKSNSGDIIIDGQKLSEISLKSYYKNIGYLTQEPSVFDGSING